MSPPGGWQPISKPKARVGAEAFHLSPFTRLARAHVLSAAGDALVTIALAGSLFFELDPNDARWRVFLYLALTMAPLAMVAPFIGPALDRSRGGRRWVLIGANAARAAVCIVMVDDLGGLLLFPEAFAVLALGKAYGVSRSALVPTVVRNDAELVEANSKLQLLSGLAAPAAALPAGLAYALGGSPAVLVTAVIAYAAATVLSLRIPVTRVAPAPATEAETAELRGIGVLLAASAMGLVRGMVGFLTFLLLFTMRDDPTWNLGVVLGLTGAGALVGSVVAPVLRRSQPEERILAAALGVAAALGIVTAWAGGLASAAAMAAGIAIVSTCAKLAFDSLVQRDAPDANRGRTFARFEVRFQLVWVIGAAIAVAFPIPQRMGYLAIAAAAGFALFSYLAGQRAAHQAHRRRPGEDGAVTPDSDEPPDATPVADDPWPDPTIRQPVDQALDPTVDPTWAHPGTDPTRPQSRS